jgi:hypothetical protein
MKAYSPLHLSPEESRKYAEEFRTKSALMDFTDSDLEHYIAEYFATYRATIEEFFPRKAPFIPFYASYPFETVIVRINNNGVFFCHRPAEEPSLRIVRPEDFDPPLEISKIFFTVQEWRFPFSSFDFRVRSYDIEEAGLCGKSDALDHALASYWSSVDEASFGQLFTELLSAEGITVQEQLIRQDLQLDAYGQVVLNEPGGFRRYENWAFEVKLARDNRVSAESLRKVELLLAENDSLDLMCLVTTGDLTSVGTYIASKNPRIRIWDRAILRLLIHEHLDVLEPHFQEYSLAAQNLSKLPSRETEFRSRLAKLAAGRDNASDYERLGTEILEYLFDEKLGPVSEQPRTQDGTQRRDVLFRNQRSSRFFQRIAEKYHADFLITDFKNYSEPIQGDVVADVAKYSNRQLGNFILVISRWGASESVVDHQVRQLRENLLVLVISDQHLLEMVHRKESNETPEDVLEDLMDELIRRY